MVCDPKKPVVLHVPDWHALATCPQCRTRWPVPHFELLQARKVLDGSAELICPKCRPRPGAEVGRDLRF